MENIPLEGDDYLRIYDIDELLLEVSNNINIIEDECEKVSNDKSIREILKPKIKTTLEHLRSCLDYSAHDIYESIYSAIDGKTDSEKRKLKIYFPYGRNINEFNKAIEKLFKDLKNKNEVIYILLESLQPYKAGDNWLVDLCNVTNTLKHNTLLKQNRENIRSLKCEKYIDIKGIEYATDFVIAGNSINGIKQKTDIIRKNGNTLLISNRDDDDVQIYDWATFTFNNTNINILKLLRKAYENVKSFKEQLYKVIL